MEIEFSKHASEQLKVRSNISKTQVLDTIKHSDESSESFRGRKLYRKKYDEGLLEVVAVKEDNKLIVVTQYLLEN